MDAAGNGHSHQNMHVSWARILPSCLDKNREVQMEKNFSHCRNVLLKQCEIKSPQPLWTSTANVADIHRQLPHRTLKSIRHKVKQVMNRPDVGVLLEDFKSGKLVVPEVRDVNNN